MERASITMGGPAVRPTGPAFWSQISRAWSLPTSVLPALAGSLVAIDSGRSSWGLLPVVLIAMALMHAGVNISNDVEDAARGIDEPDKLRAAGVFNTGMLSIREGRVIYAACFAASAALGFVICAIQGPTLLIIGLTGLLGGWLYTGGPRPYKYAGLGEPLIIPLMGPLITQGAYTAMTGVGFFAPAFWIGFGPGLLIAAVLSANNLEDMADDGAKGVRTLAVRLGHRFAQRLYGLMLAGVAVLHLLLWATGLFDAWILLPLVLVPVLATRAREVMGASSGSALEGQTERTAQLHILFTVLLCVGVVLARAVH